MPSDLANLSEALPGPPFASPRHAWLRAHSRSGTRTFRQRLPPDRAEAFAPATVASPRHPSVSRGCRAVANHIGSQHNSPSFERSLHRNVDFHALAPALVAPDPARNSLHIRAIPSELAVGAPGAHASRPGPGLSVEHRSHARGDLQRLLPLDRTACQLLEPPGWEPADEPAAHRPLHPLLDEKRVRRHLQAVILAHRPLRMLELHRHRLVRRQQHQVHLTRQPQPR